MNDSFRIIKFHKDLSNRFGHWIVFQDMRSGVSKMSGKRARKLFIKEIETLFGPLGGRWQFQADDRSRYILKLDDERDVLFFLLKFNRR